LTSIPFATSCSRNSLRREPAHRRCRIELEE
jgi:hypothetical protein